MQGEERPFGRFNGAEESLEFPNSTFSIPEQAAQAPPSALLYPAGNGGFSALIPLV
jgi:hypothetical protein